MTYYLLDTNAVSAYARGEDLALVTKVDAHGPAILLSAIVLAELEYGWQKSAPVATRRIRRQKDFARRYRPMPFDGQCAAPYGLIKNHVRHTLTRTEGNAQPIGERDQLIAAQALRLGAVLVTRNTREFSRVPDLECEDWETVA